jgi:hypothetical protein
MAITHAIFTGNPTQILHHIAVHGKTGLLSIEYRGARGIERGEIYFEGGTAVHARAGREWGKPALVRIADAGQVNYNFLEGELLPLRPSPLRRIAAKRSQRDQEMAPATGTPAGQTAPRLIAASRDVRTTQQITAPRDMRAIQQITAPRDVRITQQITVSKDMRITQQNGRGTTALPELSPMLPASGEIGQPVAQAIFRALPVATTPEAMQQMERRDRIVLMLLDGRRAVRDIGRLTNHTEVEVARILVRLLNKGSIEYVLA